MWGYEIAGTACSWCLSASSCCPNTVDLCANFRDEVGLPGGSQCFLVRYHSAVITSNGDVATFGSKITKCWKLSFCGDEAPLREKKHVKGKERLQKIGRVFGLVEERWKKVSITDALGKEISAFLGIDPVRRSLVEEFVHGTPNVSWFPTSNFYFWWTVEWFVLTGSHWKAPIESFDFFETEFLNKIHWGLGVPQSLGFVKQKLEGKEATIANHWWLAEGLGTAASGSDASDAESPGTD